MAMMMTAIKTSGVGLYEDKTSALMWEPNVRYPNDAVTV